MHRIVASLAILSSLGAAEFHVAAGVAAGGDGSPARPFATIAQGMAAAQPGDTVWLRGGTYRGAIPFPRSGTAGRPITLAAWSPDGTPERRERVVVTTALDIVPGQAGAGTWEDRGGGLWRIRLPDALRSEANRGNLLVTLDDAPLQDARWPDTDRIPDPDRARAAFATAGRVVADDVGGVATDDAGEYLIPALAEAGFADGSLAGARVVLNPGREWNVNRGRVAGNAGGVLSFLWNRNGNGVAGTGLLDPAERDWVILWDDLAFLNRSDEHWLDHDGRHGPAGMLYLRSATAPSGRRLAVGTGSLGSLQGRSHVRLAGMVWVGGSIWATNSTSDIALEGIESRLASPGINGGGAGLWVAGRRWSITDCDIWDSNANAGGIVIGQVGNTAEDVVITDTTIRRQRMVGLVNGSATAVAVRHLTAWDTGSHGVSFLSFESDYSRMHVYQAGRMTSDIALINAFGSPGAPLRTRVHHNWAHSPVSSRDRTGYRWEGCNGIRTDSGGNGIGGVSGVDIFRNIIWGEGLRNGIQVFPLHAGQTGYGNADIRVVHNTILASGPGAASISIVSQDGAAVSAAGFEIVNNLAGGYYSSTTVRDSAPPDIVHRNLFTNYGAVRGLPADSATRPQRNEVLTDPRLPGAPVRDATPGPDSPLVDAGMVHALSGPAIGAAPDIGAVERGAPAWIAGARATRRHVPGLRLRGERGADGRRWAVVGGLPPGRLIDPVARVRVAGLTLSGGQWSYDARLHQGALRFTLAGEPAGADGSVPEIDLDGDGPLPYLAMGAAATGFATVVQEAVWDAVGGTLIVTGRGLAGATEDRRPLRIEAPAGGDLRQRPVLFRIGDGGTPAQRLALVADAGGAVEPMPMSIERSDGGIAQGWAVLPDAWSQRFGPAAGFGLWVADRSDGGDRPHAAADIPGAGPAGSPDRVQWPVLGSPEALFRFIPERVDGPLGGLASRWPDAWGAVAATATGPRRPRLVADALSGLPALRFDGAQGMDHPGASASAPIIFVTVYRNQDPGGAGPGTRTYQRLVETGGAGRGAGLTVLTTATGAAVPREAATIRALQQNEIRERAPLRLGSDARTGAASQSLVGWLGETMVFSVKAQSGAIGDASDYLATKYRVHPAGRLADGPGAVQRAISATYAGRALVARSISADRIEFVPRDGGPAVVPWGEAVVDLGPVLGPAPLAVQVAGDTVAPATPPAPAVGPAGHPRPLISGITEPRAVVRIRIDGAVVASLGADGAGTWSWTPAQALAPGLRSVSVDATDASGNRSPWSAARQHPVNAGPLISVPATAPSVLALP